MPVFVPDHASRSINLWAVNDLQASDEGVILDGIVHGGCWTKGELKPRAQCVCRRSKAIESYVMPTVDDISGSTSNNKTVAPCLFAMKFVATHNFSFNFYSQTCSSWSIHSDLSWRCLRCRCHRFLPPHSGFFLAIILGWRCCRWGLHSLSTLLLCYAL